MKRLEIMILGLWTTGIVLMAQNTNQPFTNACAPSVSFQSTGVMAPSGSPYASQPMINSDGSALYNGPAYAPAAGPRRAPGVPTTPGAGNEENKFPLSDSLFPLLFLAIAYAAWTGIRIRRKTT